MEPTQDQDIFSSAPPFQKAGAPATTDTTPPPVPENPVIPPKPKRKFPKMFIYAGIGILAILLIFIVVRMISSRLKPQTSEIVWWGLWEDENIVAPLIAEYETKNPKVKIKYVRQSQRDYRERLTSSFAKGQGPDIFRFHNTWAPMFRNDLDPVPASVINPADFAKTFYPIASSDLTMGTGIVGIPLEYDALTLYINEDIFNNAGKVPPTNWDELRILAKELTVKDDQGVITQSGVALGRVENVDHWQEILALLMIQNGVDLSKPTGEQAEDALTYFTLPSAFDGVWDATLPSSTAAFAGGKLAMYFGPSWRAFEIALAGPNLKFKTVPVPQLPKSSPTDPDVSYATYWVEGVWSRSTKKDAAWDFLKFLSTKESLQKLYQSASKTRSFGEPYARVDMGTLLKDHPVLASIISQAPGSQSWYLASRTFDGPTGINSLISKYFEDAINAVISGKAADKSLETAAQGVSQVLSQYRLSR
jgi:multiple sugar transport system substrate-binding protein